ncbi:MAG: pyridoxamine 5'-phosphate oxidase family protein [Bacteroidota bacterium]
MELYQLAQSELIRSNADRRHPFRYFYLATMGTFPEVRTVVKRNIDLDWNLLFFTDARSPKVEQIKANPNVSALFYHPKKKLQIRMNGHAQIIHDHEDDFDQWLQQVKQSKTLKDYTTTIAPGSAINDGFEISYGDAIHFLPIKIEPLHLDILQLFTTQHKRSAYNKEGAIWKETTLVP